jgi:hypothetical protein
VINIRHWEFEIKLASTLQISGISRESKIFFSVVIPKHMTDSRHQQNLFMIFVKTVKINGSKTKPYQN